MSSETPVEREFHQRPGPRIPLWGALLMSPLAGPGRHRHFSFFSLIPLFIPLPFFPFLHSSVISDKGASLNVGKIWIESKKKNENEPCPSDKNIHDDELRDMKIRRFLVQ